MAQAGQIAGAWPATRTFFDNVHPFVHSNNTLARRYHVWRHGTRVPSQLGGPIYPCL